MQSFSRFVSSLRPRLSANIAHASVRSAVTCVVSIEETTAEEKWVERRVANAKLWWYRTSKDRLPCPRGVRCPDPNCKLLHPMCLAKNCVDKFCPYSHPSRAKPVKQPKDFEDIKIVGK